MSEDYAKMADKETDDMAIEEILLYEVRELRKEVKKIDDKVVNLRLQFVRIKIMSGFWGAFSGLGTAIGTIIVYHFRSIK